MVYSETGCRLVAFVFLTFPCMEEYSLDTFLVFVESTSEFSAYKNHIYKRKYLLQNMTCNKKYSKKLISYAPPAI